MGNVHQVPPSASPAPEFRLDVQLHDLLTENAGRTRVVPKPSGLETFPEPVFPQHPQLVRNHEEVLAQPHIPPEKRRWSPGLIYRVVRGWGVPYLQSRVLSGEFHPIIAYLFTEWKCNLDCHYCWAFDNTVKGMTEDVAKRSIDWLHSTTCRVLALMGGEPLLRPQFVHKIVDYAAKKDFWVYVPTNGRLLRPEVIDRLGDSGAAVFNLAVDAVDEKEGLPKALNAIRKNFEYLVRRQYDYGYIVFFNINICRNNIEDVKRLTEIAREHKLITDYHINESPMMHQPHFQHMDNNGTFIRSEDFPKVDELIDWLIEKNRSGYKMVNSTLRLNDMREFMHGKIQEWNCRAGQNNVIIRVDGTLGPCFPMYSATHDWGVIEKPRFEDDQLKEMKKGCQPHCFSTLNHNLAHSYDDGRAIRWVMKQAARGFQGVSGSFN
jgi:MoaA/NifB/PqqE/SkfB family radical SAM enzyme